MVIEFCIRVVFICVTALMVLVSLGFAAITIKAIFQSLKGGIYNG